MLVIHHLENGAPWFAGNEFSAVDVLIGFVLEAVSDRLAPAAEYPNIANFAAQIRLRPAYQRAMAKGLWSVESHHLYWEFFAK